MELFEEADLLDRLKAGHRAAGRPVVFLVGSPLVAPVRPGGPGVPGVTEMIRRIQIALERTDIPSASSANPYQDAFRALQGRRGQDAVNELVRRAVLEACTSSDRALVARAVRGDEDACQLLERDESAWHLSPGVEALGRILAGYPAPFGRLVLTSNFDPLLQVSIAHAGGRSWRTALHGDGNLGQAQGEGCHVVQIHGHWYGADTLHTPTQLAGPRPNLSTSLSRLFARSTLVVIAYGGWQDAFTSALLNVVTDDGAFPDVLWTFVQTEEQEIRTSRAGQLLAKLQPGLARSRVTLYRGIECHTFFARLWQQLERENRPAAAGKKSPQSVHKKSPFIVGPPILRDQDLFGRQAQKDLLSEALGSGQALQIIGERRMGKSSLLEWVRRHGSELQSRPVVYINAQGPAGQSLTNLIQEIAGSPSLSRKTGEHPERFLDLLPLLLLIDEAEALCRPDRGFGQDFLNELRAFCQDGRLIWISASRVDLQLLFQPQGLSSAFLNDSRQVKVGQLELEAARALLRQALDPQLVSQILDEVAGFPFALQMLGDLTLRSPGDFGSACNELAESMTPTFQDWWRHRTQEEKSLLKRCLAGQEIGSLSASGRRHAWALSSRGLLVETAGRFEVPGLAWKRFLEEVCRQ